MIRDYLGHASQGPGEGVASLIWSLQKKVLRFQSSMVSVPPQVAATALKDAWDVDLFLHYSRAWSLKYEPTSEPLHIKINEEVNLESGIVPNGTTLSLR